MNRINIFDRFRGVLWKLGGRRRQGVYYVNGPDVLPQPLTKEEEAAVIATLEGGSADAEQARSLLIERNLRLVAFIARRYENSGVGIEDLISIGTLGLIKAVGTFRSDKNIKLATYASRCIENEILMHLRKISGRQEVSIDEPLNTDWDGNELLLSDVLGSDEEPVIRELEEEEERLALRRAVARLTERERYIIELRFGLNGRREMTQNQVAELLGISQSYISRLEKKILKKLREDLDAG
ncbi:MAG: sigma-70 family RNA polymerase sigma factor [Ruminococcaceae bacterium]|nr:sigma-70 family RNA polymerase sigma factor [Oscillospiraceae bacterium]